MAYGNFTIDGVPIKNPHDFQLESYTLTQSLRVANGDMQMDFVANKRKFVFTYTSIQSDDLDLILDLLWDKLATTKQCFHALTYIENNINKTAIVYAGAIPRKLHRGHGAKWVWKDVQFSLIER